MGLRWDQEKRAVGVTVGNKVHFRAELGVVQDPRALGENLPHSLNLRLTRVLEQPVNYMLGDSLG